MKTILLTGFEPFGGESMNPSWECVKPIEGDFPTARIITARLPVVWGEAQEMLFSLMGEHSPDAVLSIGQAGGSTAVRIERIAINLCECESPDNTGRILTGEPVVKDGPAAYFSTLPHEKLRAAIRNIGFPAEYSFSAGTFLCNSVMYAALHAASAHTIAGFIHLPYAEGQEGAKNAYSMPLSALMQSVIAAVEALIEAL